MTIKAKEVLDGKFWIVEDEGVNIGTLSFDDEKYMLNDTSGNWCFNYYSTSSKELFIII